MENNKNRQQFMEIKKFVKENHINLSVEEVNELFKDKEKNKDIIFKSQLALVLNISGKTFRKKNKNFGEIFADGLFGLSNAFKTFKPNKGYMFSSYAKVSIQNTIYDNLKKDNIIRQPFSNLRGAQVATARVFSDYIKTTEEGDYEILNRRLSDTIDSVTPKDNESVLKQFIFDTIKDDKKASIISDNLGLCLDKKKSMEAIGKEWGVTKQNISQLIIREMKKLKENEKFVNKLKDFYGF